MYKIAVVDDNEDNVVLLQAILQDRYNVSTFINGLDALKSFTQNPPDLVLLDISLPIMSGPEVLKQIRQNEQLKPLRVVALTAHAMKGDEEKFLKMGFDAYLSKPIIEEQVLFDTIERLLV